MKIIANASLFPVLMSVLALTACTTAATSPAPGTTYTGEIWTWDEAENTVTLRAGLETFRVKVTPEQIRGLRLHQFATLRGELAPPAEIERIIVPSAPLTAVPRGPVDQNTVTGTVTAVDPRGRLSIDSTRGPVHVWAAAGADVRFPMGSRVRVEMSVQPVDMVPAASQDDAGASPAASPGSRPGDYAVVRGRVIGVEQAGTVIVESPTGPVQVWVGDSSRYRVSQPVQVRTVVSRLD